MKKLGFAGLFLIIVALSVWIRLYTWENRAKETVVNQIEQLVEQRNQIIASSSSIPFLSSELRQQMKQLQTAPDEVADAQFTDIINQLEQSSAIANEKQDQLLALSLQASQIKTQRPFQRLFSGNQEVADETITLLQGLTAQESRYHQHIDQFSQNNIAFFQALSKGEKSTAGTEELNPDFSGVVELVTETTQQFNHSIDTLYQEFNLGSPDTPAQPMHE